MSKRAVFFAKVEDVSILERNEFYAVDLRILRESGWEVTVTIDPFRIPAADVYFVWWWTWAVFPLLRARLAGRPIVIVGVFDHVLADGSLEGFPKRSAVHRTMMRAALRFADANVFCSRLELERLQQEFTIRNASFSHCAVDGALFRPASVPREPFVLSFCWMNAHNPKRKCIAESIRAVAALHARYPAYQYRICGAKLEGYPELQRLVDDLGATEYIQFLGVVSREEKVALMQRCAVYLQPTRVEGFGLAIAEAMACGAPVVSSPVGTVPEVVGDAALLVDGASPEAIATGLTSLLDDEPGRLALGKRAHERVAAMFTYEKRKADITRVLHAVMPR
ncbi:MAG: glycosyltransferase family 4 protein [bacterium]